MTIPASQLVNVIPSVLSAGGNPLSLNAVMLTRSASLPIGDVVGFASVTDVEDYFGPTSIEATLAAKYFAGFTNCTSLPSLLYFAQYNDVAVAAYLRSGSFEGTTLAQLQGLSGILIVDIDGSEVTSANINLAGATSFTNAAALIQAGLQTPGGIFTGTGTISDGAGAAGNTLNITAVTSGALKLGDIVTGGVSPAAITAFLTGAGGIGTYTVGGAAQDFDPGGTLQVSSAATVTYDAQLHRFLIHSPTTGVNSTIDYATGSIAAGLKFQAAQAAEISDGAAVAVPAAFMPTVSLATQNWATFMTTFEPDLDEKLEFAAWVQTTEERFAYVAWDSDPAPLDGDAPASFAAQLVTSQSDGIWPQYEPADDDGNGRKAAFICGTVASIDFNRRNGRISFAYRGQAGLVPDILNGTIARNLAANGYNFYGSYGSGRNLFVNTQEGTTPGAWKYFEQYINQIWLNSELQLALLSMLMRENSIPYNSEGYNLIRATCTDPIQRALFNGVIRTGVTLSNSQRASINTAAGVEGAADSLQNNGYYLQILNAPPEVRAVHGSPPCTLWYTDGGSIRTLQLASINVQ